MAELYVIGDSFSYLHPDKESQNERVWSVALAKKLKCGLYNSSCAGSSQDWLIDSLYKFRNQITPDDHIVLVMTHPSRFWFFDEYPQLCNPFIIDFDRDISSGQSDAVAAYYKHIQRDTFDLRHQTARLGNIANLARVHGWRDPIIMFGFETKVMFKEDCPNLKFANGFLTQDPSVGELSAYKEILNLFSGNDPRFNHLCLDNHDILVEKLYKTLIHGEDLDLTTGFIKDIITPDFLTNKEFCDSQLDPVGIKRLKESQRQISKYLKPVTPFVKRAGLTHLPRQF